MVELKNRQVEFFRCHIEPGITPMPKNAIHAKELKLEACELTPAGIYVKSPTRGEFLVPYANVQSIKLAPEDENKPKMAK